MQGLIERLRIAEQASIEAATGQALTSISLATKRASEAIQRPSERSLQLPLETTKHLQLTFSSEDHLRTFARMLDQRGFENESMYKHVTSQVEQYEDKILCKIEEMHALESELLSMLESTIPASASFMGNLQTELQRKRQKVSSAMDMILNEHIQQHRRENERLDAEDATQRKKLIVSLY